MPLCDWALTALANRPAVTEQHQHSAEDVFQDTLLNCFGLHKPPGEIPRSLPAKCSIVLISQLLIVFVCSFVLRRLQVLVLTLKTAAIQLQMQLMRLN